MQPIMPDMLYAVLANIKESKLHRECRKQLPIL